MGQAVSTSSVHTSALVTKEIATEDLELDGQTLMKKSLKLMLTTVATR